MKRFSYKNFVLLSIFLLLSISGFSQAGSLDLSFGTGGRVLTDILGGSHEYAKSVVVQEDGKIIVVGEVIVSGYMVELTVVRYNTDGTLDLTFDLDGIAVTDLGDSIEGGASVVLQTDGKIVVCGTSGRSSYSNIAVARYNTNGSLDNSFDTDGIVITDIGGTFNKGYSVTIQADGKLVVSGQKDYDVGLVRYNTDGSLDNTFDSDGMLSTDFGGNDYGNSVKIQSDGKIVVGGYRFGGPIDFILARYNTDGSLDNSFDADGMILTDFAGTGDYGYSLAIQNDGKILLAGTIVSPTRFALARYNSNGSLDNSLDVDGKLIYDFAGTSYDNCKAVACQIDGKIVLAGFTSVTGFGPSDASMVRFNSDGSLDNSFDSDGVVTTSFGGNNNSIHTIAIQPDGKLIIAGRHFSAGQLDMQVIRYHNNIIGIGIEENNNELFHVFPNPSFEKITIQFGINLENASLKLSNISGETLMQKENLSGNSFNLDVSNLASGVYYLALSVDEEQYFTKIIKQ